MKNAKPVILVLFCLYAALWQTRAQEKLTRQQYIERYKDVAMEEMDVYGIPASIKMAQALFESDNGNSRLAREANNHFGIKCKTDWTGGTISHDDDARGECFRKYSTPLESFRDHSEFLDKSARYQDLFKLDPMDYKGWAYGLKKAGYATNPAYAEMLIKIIEDNRLYLLDQGRDIPSQMFASEFEKPAPKEEIPTVTHPAELIDVDNYIVSVQAAEGRHAVYRNNGSLFVLSTQTDNYGSIADEFRLSPRKLYKFNDVPEGAELAPGEMVYIRKKNKRSENGKLIHVVRENETLHGISQMYGIRLDNLINLNRRPKGSEVRPGQQIRLM